MMSLTKARQAMLRDAEKETHDTKCLAKTLMDGIVSPMNTTMNNEVIPGLSNGERLLSVNGSASISVAAGTKSALVVMDETSLRAGQLAAFVIERTATRAVNYISKINVGESSEFLASGGIISSELYGKNTSGTDNLSGTVCGGLLPNVTASIINFTHSDLAAQTHDTNFASVDSKQSGVSVLNTSNGLLNTCTLGPGLRVKGVENVRTLINVGVSGDAEDVGGLTYEVAIDTKKNTVLTSAFGAGVFNLDFEASLRIRGGDETNTVGGPIYSGMSMIIQTYDWNDELIDSFPHSQIWSAVDIAADFPMFHVNVKESVTNSKFPISSVKVLLRDVSPAGGQAHTSIGLQQDVTMSASFPLMYETMNRSVLLFEGLNDNSTLSVSAGALMHVTPQPDRYGGLMGRPMLKNTVHASAILDSIEALIQHMPGAFSDSSKDAFIKQLALYDDEGTLELAFSMRSFSSFAKGLQRFGRDAISARHLISDIAKTVRPMLQEATAIPGIGGIAGSIAKGISTAQDLGVLEARTIYNA
uniref:Capsid n=1 Tax=viral metagenome TaxID=1070528 RepID=A0A2V0RAQ1_9ZZZZ